MGRHPVLWHRQLPDEVLNADLFIRQATLTYTDQMAAWDHRIRRLVTVAPMAVPPAATTPRAEQAIVVFGGMEADGWYRVGDQSQYPHTVTRLLTEEVDLSPFDVVLVTGNTRVLDELRRRHGRNPKLRFETLPHRQFLAEVARSAMALLVGGIQSTIETFGAGTPAVFLPPSNSSQYQHILQYRRLGVADASIHFVDYLPALDFDQMDRHQVEAAFLAQLAIIEQAPDILADVARRLSSWVGDTRLLEATGRRQADYLRSLGSDGAERAAEPINTWWAGAAPRP